MRLVLSVAALVLLSGCAWTRPLDVADADGRRQLNARAERQTPTVTVVGEAPVAVRGLAVGPDSTRWIDAETGALRVVPTAEVAVVRFPRGERSALRPFLVSTGVGVGLGALIGLTAESNLVFSDRGYLVALGAAAFGVVGGIVGAGAAADATAAERFVPSDSTGAPLRR